MHVVFSTIRRQLRNPINLVSLVMLLALLTSSIWYTLDNEAVFYQLHITQAQQATKTVKFKLEEEHKDKQWLTRVFLQNNRADIERLIREPENDSLYNAINIKLDRYFPDFFNFNIAREDGSPVVDDFDGKLGEICIADLRRFQRDGEEQTRLHPSPLRYHYDILNRFTYDDRDYILFVSFDFARIASILRNAQPDQHRLLLIDKRHDYLIEVLDFGSRKTMRNRDDYHMTDEERASILYERQIANSQWHIVDIHEKDLFTDYNSINRMHGAALSLTLVLLMLIAWRLLHRYDEKRKQMQKRLVTRNRKISRLNEELLQTSITDSLTGLYNRRFFEETTIVKWGIAARTNQVITFVMLDVDHFKLYNDTYGHPAGDECLRKLSREMSKVYTRSIDIIARYGGEEFIIVTIGINYEESLHLANKLLHNIEALHIKHEASPISDYVTVSAGLTCIVPALDDSIEKVIQRTDAALYEAKALGRNQTVSCDLSDEQKPA